MARRSTIEDPSRVAPSQGGAALSVDPQRKPPERAGTAADGQRLLVRAHLHRGDIATALAALRAGAGVSGRADAVAGLVELALEDGRVQLARSVLAFAEDEAQGHLPQGLTAQIKARIALAQGDLDAARAILVMAVEADPAAPALRALLAETMVAAGTAADARAVLSTLGAAPVNPDPDPRTRPQGSLPEIGTRTC